jgi:hypothetical protein
MQANARKVKGDLKLEKDERTAIRDALRILWHKPTKTKFNTFLQALLSEWDRRIPQYSAYFRLTWLNVNPPTGWASYARPKDARSGNQLTSFRTFLYFFFFDYLTLFLSLPLSLFLSLFLSLSLPFLSPCHVTNIVVFRILLL